MKPIKKIAIALILKGNSLQQPPSCYHWVSDIDCFFKNDTVKDMDGNLNTFKHKTHNGIIKNRINASEGASSMNQELDAIVIEDGSKTWRQVIDNWQSGNIPKKMPYEGFMKSSRIHSLDSLAQLYYFKDISGQLASLRHTPDLAFNGRLKINRDKIRVTSFNNLKGDAKLIVPMPDGEDYATLYRFMKNAPETTQQALFKKTADVIFEHKSGFLNTEGTGEHHLHIRLDNAPKYYSRHHKNRLGISINRNSS